MTLAAPKIPGNSTPQTSVPCSLPDGRPAHGARLSFPGDPPGVPAEPRPWTFFPRDGMGLAARGGCREGQPGPGRAEDARPSPPAQVEVAPAAAHSGPARAWPPVTPSLALSSGAGPSPPSVCPPPPLHQFRFCLFWFLPSTLLKLTHHPLHSSHPPPTWRAELGGLCAPLGLRGAPSEYVLGAGNEVEANWGAERSGAGRSAASGRGGAAQGPGQSCASPARALRPSPSVGPKLLKLQKCAGACPPTANKTKQTRRKEKRIWRC